MHVCNFHGTVNRSFGVLIMEYKRKHSIFSRSASSERKTSRKYKHSTDESSSDSPTTERESDTKGRLDEQTDPGSGTRGSRKTHKKIRKRYHSSDSFSTVEKKRKKEKKKKMHKRHKERDKEVKDKKKKKHKMFSDKDVTDADMNIKDEVGPNPAPKILKPMTKKEWEKQQSIIRRVYDPETGRDRLVKGDGEIIEEIVSKERHKEINKQATQGDGLHYQKLMGMSKNKCDDLLG